MKIKEPLSIENPFKKTGTLWVFFGSITLISGIVLLLLTKSDFTLLKVTIREKDDGTQLVYFGNFLTKLIGGLILLSVGVKYLKVSLSAIFNFEPSKRVTENLASDISEKKHRSYPYNKESLITILETRELELIKPTGTIENIMVRIFQGLRILSPRYYYVAYNFVSALVSSFSPFLIVLIVLFLNYLEIIEVFTNNKFSWLMMFVTISLLFAWSPFSPISNARKVNHKALVLTICSLGTLLVLRSGSVDFTLPEIPASIFFVTSSFFVLSAALFSIFFYLLKRRIEIETTDDSISIFKVDTDIDLHPNEIHRVLSNRLVDLGSANLPNRIYSDVLKIKNSNLEINLMHETQPSPCHSIKDSILIHSANRFIFIGFCISVFAAVLMVVLASSITTVLGQILSLIFGIGLINFGLKLIHLSNLFTSEFLFESKLLTVLSRGEFKSSQVTAGRSVYDSVESRNEISRSSLSLQVVATKIKTVSFLKMGQSDPLQNAPRYIISMEKDDEALADIVKALNQHLGEKSQIVGISNDVDIQKIKGMAAMNKKQPHELLKDGLGTIEIKDN